MDVTELIVSLVYNDKGKVIGEKYHGELIRCRECKYYSQDETFRVMKCMNDDGLLYATEDAYCSYAERKEECSR